MYEYEINEVPAINFKGVVWDKDTSFLKCSVCGREVTCAMHPREIRDWKCAGCLVGEGK